MLIFSSADRPTSFIVHFLSVLRCIWTFYISILFGRMFFMSKVNNMGSLMNEFLEFLFITASFRPLTMFRLRIL